MIYCDFIKQFLGYLSSLSSTFVLIHVPIFEFIQSHHLKYIIPILALFHSKVPFYFYWFYYYWKLQVTPKYRNLDILDREKNHHARLFNEFCESNFWISVYSSKIFFQLCQLFNQSFLILSSYSLQQGQPMDWDAYSRFFSSVSLSSTVPMEVHGLGDILL